MKLKKTFAAPTSPLADPDSEGEGLLVHRRNREGHPPRFEQPEPLRVAYLVSHPIQYQAPLLKRVASEPGIRLKAFFCSDFSTHPFIDSQFKRKVRWDVPLLEGYEYEFLPMIGSSKRLSFWLPWNTGLAERLSNGGFDALWVHSYMRAVNWRAIASAKRRGMAVFLRDDTHEFSRPRGPLRRFAKRFLFKVLSRTVDCFLAIGTMNRDYYLSLGIPSDRIVMMPYAVDNRTFQLRSREASLRRETFRVELGLTEARPVILYVGKLYCKKGPQDLLDAYAHLSLDGHSEPLPYLLFVGDGEARASLEASAASLGWRSIRFLGFKNQSELPAYYDLCDFFVMPSTRESWGLVVNEAMNAGRPVVTSDRVGAHVDLVKDGVNGYVYRAGSVNDLHRVLLKILNDRELRLRMGQESLNIVNRWSFEEDVAALTKALSAFGRRHRSEAGSRIGMRNIEPVETDRISAYDRIDRPLPPRASM